ncbi:hypothetical protein GCM10010116_03740 [Microbispora rosea subsp. aerata]|nr:hypothetical protein [Microbispora rosea]GGO01976.1 hypothetical protein GCM10010116_03740 [Microbispora rosea subsp. aerata]GIH54725.1 hypothetical protein Mro02_16390 [Microbispora rosea subsp. aerata]GLJ86339.1 hypothetical protein GCM10017588_50750 [Microbispora rosea subsp. aerata]
MVGPVARVLDPVRREEIAQAACETARPLSRDLGAARYAVPGGPAV